MTERMLLASTLAAALGSGLMAGLYFAFSAFIMTAFARLPPAGGIAAMQSINMTILNPLFLAYSSGRRSCAWCWRSQHS